MGNEPSFEVPYIYTFAGAPSQTQAALRRIINQLFTNTAGGIPGNDDGGAMGSWTVFSMMGLYPEIPGVGGFVVSGPFFSSVAIHIAGGHVIQINAPQASDANLYIQGLSVNGVSFGSSWLPWSNLSSGATLEFKMGSSPDKTWATALNDRPPSFDPDPLVQTF